MVRELDVSRITLRLVEEVDKKGDYESESHIRAKLTGETLAILRQALVSHSFDVYLRETDLVIVYSNTVDAQR